MVIHTEFMTKVTQPLLCGIGQASSVCKYHAEEIEIAHRN